MPQPLAHFNFCAVMEDPMGRRACPLQFVVKANSIKAAEEKLENWLQDHYGNMNVKWDILPATYID